MAHEHMHMQRSSRGSCIKREKNSESGTYRDMGEARAADGRGRRKRGHEVADTKRG